MTDTAIHRRLAAGTSVHEMRLYVPDAERFFEPGRTLAGERRISAELENWILERSAAAPQGARLRLALEAQACESAAAESIPAALEAHFRKRREEEASEIKRSLRDGRTAVLIGFGFLLIVNAIAEGIRASFDRPFAVGIANGLEIFGWVAMWRPAELLLYDWFPALRKKRQFERLAGMEIAYVTTSAT